MIQALKIRNREVITRLDLMAKTVYKQPASYNQAPKPNITLARLRTAMAANDGKHELTNNIDYVGRESPDGGADFGRLRNIFRNIICSKTGTQQWYWDTYMAQVPYWGWTGWNNSKGKGKMFLRFIHNSGRGETRYVSKGRYKKIPDQHSVYNADWTLLIGEQDGLDDWMADRNYNKKPRCVLELAIPSTNKVAWQEACDYVNSV